MLKAYEIQAWAVVCKSKNGKSKRLEYLGNQYVVSVFDEQMQASHDYFPYLNRATKFFNSIKL